MYYSFPVTSDNIQWLHLMYNNDAVLRYRLNIKKELAKQKRESDWQENFPIPLNAASYYAFVELTRLDEPYCIIFKTSVMTQRLISRIAIWILAIVMIIFGVYHFRQPHSLLEYVPGNLPGGINSVYVVGSAANQFRNPVQFKVGFTVWDRSSNKWR